MKRMYDENEIKSIASEASSGGKLYRHCIEVNDNIFGKNFIYLISSRATTYTVEALIQYAKNISDITYNAISVILMKGTQNGFQRLASLQGFGVGLTVWYSNNYGDNATDSINFKEIVSDNVFEV